MTAPVATCPDHGGYFEAACPRCGDAGDRVLSGARRRQLSTFLSGALRHFPDDVGLSLGAAGWASWSAVVACIDRQYDWAGDREVEAVVATDPKGRFETRTVDGRREVRAAYGHSVDVDLDGEEGGDGGRDSGHDHDHDPDDRPDRLYHGTAPRTLDAIRAAGLKPMGRQAVHLSGSRETAREVGRRHTIGDDPVVLVVDADGLVDAGFEVTKRGVDTYTVARVPPWFLSPVGEEW